MDVVVFASHLNYLNVRLRNLALKGNTSRIVVERIEEKSRKDLTMLTF